MAHCKSSSTRLYCSSEYVSSFSPYPRSSRNAYSSVVYLTRFLLHLSSRYPLCLFSLMELLQKIPQQLLAISSSWDSFYESNSFLQKLRQHLPSRSLPRYLALAAFLTTVASALFLLLRKIRYHRDGRIWEVETSWTQGSAVQLSPRDMAANDTLGVSPTMARKRQKSFYVTMMSRQLTSDSSKNYSR